MCFSNRYCQTSGADICRIPFERALDFANKEKITEQLYPLFVHDIGALLYHPSNQQRPGNALAAVDRRRDTRYLAGPQTTQAPSLHHHHTMSTPIGAHASQAQQSIAPHPGAGRPGLDRAHTFPTPPTSASSIMGMENQGSSYGWGGAAVSGDNYPKMCTFPRL
jgi:protein SOK2